MFLHIVSLLQINSKKIIHAVVLFFVFSINLHAQTTDSLLLKLFYGVNPNQTRNAMYSSLQHDKRYSQVITSYNDTGMYSLPPYTYYGKMLRKEVTVPGNPDSVDVQISFGTGIFSSACYKKEKEHHFSSSFLRYDYYFNSADSLQKAYNYVLNLIQASGKKLTDTAIYGPASNGEVGEGVYYYYPSPNNFKPCISIFKITSLSKSYYLQLEYEREGD